MGSDNQTLNLGLRILAVPIHDFPAFFTEATSNEPCPYQRRLASEPVQSRLIHVATGCVKLAAVILDRWVPPGQSAPVHASYSSALSLQLPSNSEGRFLCQQVPTFQRPFKCKH